MRVSLVGRLLLLLLIVSPVAYGQYSGTIRGTVSDPSGAVISGADVTVTNPATATTRTVKSSEAGEFVVPNLPAGTYEVRIKQGNFKEFVVKAVELHVSSTAVVDARLQMGSAVEQVTVEADALQVQTNSAQVGEVVTNQQVRELPLNGRSLTQLTLLQPGVSARDGLDTKNKGLLSGVDFSVNGNPVTNNLWLVDGANNNDLGSNRTILVYPSLDAIAEFKMLRNSYGAEYGQASGGIISIVTKSGTNAFHGGVYYYGRNDALNATEYFARQGEIALEQLGAHAPNNGKDVLRRNDYGYFIGGPVKKDKLFFFWSQEWNKEKRGVTRKACVPTLAERNGDFTQGVSCGATAPHVPGGSAPLLTIPTLDPAGVLIADLLPLPNVTPSAGTGFKNWFQSLSSPVTWRQENARADFQATQKHRISFRYTQDSWDNLTPNTQTYWGDDPFPAVEGSWSQPSKSIIASLNSTITSSLTNDLQFSYSNNRIFATLGGTGTEGNPGGELSPQELVSALDAAIPTVFPSSDKKPGGLGIGAAWGGLGNYGDGQSLWLISPWQNSSDLYQFRDDLAKVYNNHTVKTGFYFTYNGKNEPNFGGQDRPQLGLSSSVTGNPLADLLLPGTVYGVGETSVNLFPHARWKDIEFYVQDSWKIRRNLSLEYGIRWSFLRQPYELSNKIASFLPQFYDPAGTPGDACNGLAIVPGTDPCGDANAALGTNFSSGHPGVGRALVENGNHNIAPRLGVSWDPWGDGKTAIRAGVGQFYQRERVSTVTAVLGQNAPFALNFFTNRTLDAAPVLGVPGGSPKGSRDPRPIIPNSWQWNVSVERELAKATTLQLGYVGNRGIHLTSDADINEVRPEDRLAAAFGNLQSFRPMPLVNGIQQFGHSGSSSYHALQAQFRSQLTNHSQVQVSYTWSHTLSNVDLSDSSGSNFGTHTTTDVYNLRADWGNSEINRPHIFVANVVYSLPTLAGQQAVMKNVLGGWELSGIFTAQSGNSVTVRGPGQNLNFLWHDPSCPLDAQNVPTCSGSIANPSGTGLDTEDSGNATRLISTGINCSSGRDAFHMFNPNAFTLVGYEIGSVNGVGRGTCLGPKLVNLDMGIHKNWKVGERLNIQFRFEGFNLFNHAQFLTNGAQLSWLAGQILCGDGTQPCSPTNNVVGSVTSVKQDFGNATRTRGPREFQYALKFTF